MKMTRHCDVSKKAPCLTAETLTTLFEGICALCCSSCFCTSKVEISVSIGCVLSRNSYSHSYFFLSTISATLKEHYLPSLLLPLVMITSLFLLGRLSFLVVELDWLFFGSPGEFPERRRLVSWLCTNRVRQCKEHRVISWWSRKRQTSEYIYRKVTSGCAVTDTCRPSPREL